MKTTVEIDDDLLVRAKQRAAQLRRPLRSLIEAGLRDQLATKRSSARARPAKLKWVTVDGGVPDAAHVESREAMHEWLQS